VEAEERETKSENRTKYTKTRLVVAQNHIHSHNKSTTHCNTFTAIVTFRVTTALIPFMFCAIYKSVTSRKTGAKRFVNT
jgi:hypothetical protein